jgi:branched-chain amino acid transport system substrate-binding protein
MHRRILRPILFLMLSGALAAEVDCGRKPETLTIAVIMPFTGPEAAAAKEHLNGIILRVEELNVPEAGVAYRIVSDNDQNNPAAARAAFMKELVEEKIDVAFVATRSGALAVAPDADREFVPLFANCSHPLMTIMHFYAFRNYPSSGAEIKTMRAFASQSLKIGSVALLYSDDDYGKDAANFIRQEFPNGGISIAAEASYGGAPTEPAASVSAILAHTPPAIYVFGRGPAAAAVFQALRVARYRGIVLGSSDIARGAVKDLASAALEGVYCAATAFELSGNADFADRYRRRFRAEPTLNCAVEYDAVKILASAVEIKNREKISLSNALKKVGDFNGVLGSYRYVDREWLPPMRVVQVRGGSLSRP